jgi:glutathione S-transferase
MSLRLYSLSGSPFGWKVQLALEFKCIRYEITHLSADKGDLDTDGFRGLNPYGKAPVLVDGDFVLFESDSIVEYLEDAFPESGSSLWPRETRRRALARRIAIEASAYLYPPIRLLVTAWSAPHRAPERTPVASDGATAERAVVEEAKTKIKARLHGFAALLTEPFFTGAEAGAADFAVYPLVALVKRLDAQRPDEGLAALIPDPIYVWRRQIEAVPGFASTYPPHWRD